MRNLAIAIAAAAVLVGLGSLFFCTGTEGDAPPESAAIEEARQRHAREQERAERERQAQAEREAALRERLAARTERMAAPTPATEDTEPELDENGLPSRGEPFDPYNPKLTGDPLYDTRTRRSAAHNLYSKGDYAAAVAMAREVLEERPDDLRTLLLIVRSACSLNDARLAREFYQRLPEDDRHRVGAPCSEAGIVLGDVEDEGPGGRDRPSE